MINAILNGIISIITFLVDLILSPIDALISTYLPDLSSAFESIGSFFELCFTYVGWGIDFLGIPSILISLVILYYNFKLTVPLLVSTIKLAIKWYNSLKL